MIYNRIEDPSPPEKHFKDHEVLNNPSYMDTTLESSINANQRVLEEISDIKTRLSDLEKKTEEVLDILKGDN
ncbi:hypothetical protein [Candidatus Nitrosocosmicus sp. SS]|jgi:hypothetical protein|uniref:hypothetical protein n=1 Tax=Candidatus Nitrosocosmicus agrestis TaxID=2563600 RepID=UPI00122DD19E|nr:hypothetical protein [Candidatus Nitrosocosmicus sp. SS]KAA2280694.1 hypothetical protein F1Z66_10425 [Candidatus Nitrosocosmicus sp. SS]KAF0869322.1 hypothetical protein E5N71_05490 [Candidatus Nitrosocosmicus sp. SS]